MGMYDSFYDRDGNGWQTKAYDCNLDVFRVGDVVPGICDVDATAYQVEILGRRSEDYDSRDSFATIRDGRVSEIDVWRDRNLPGVDYFGRPVRSV